MGDQGLVEAAQETPPKLLELKLITISWPREARISSGLFNFELLVGLYFCKMLNAARRPVDFERYLLVIAQPEMYPQVAAGCVPHTVGDAPDLCTACAPADDTGSQCRPVALPAAKLDL